MIRVLEAGISACRIPRSVEHAPHADIAASYSDRPLRYVRRGPRMFSPFWHDSGTRAFEGRLDTTMNNKSTLLTMALIGLPFANALHAQGGKGVGDHEQHCIMADNDTWMRLGITPAQLAEVAVIRDAFRNDHETARNAGMPTADTVAMHEAYLRTVLTAEQFLVWTDWCSNKKV